MEFSTKGQTQWNAGREALATRHAERPAPLHIRRVSRAQETSARAVRWAIPSSSVLATHTAQAWRACLDHEELHTKRGDRRRNTLAVLWVLLRYTEFDSMTVRITWATIAEKARVSRSTVGAILFDLRAWGLLGIVASGRSAEYAAKAGQEAQNEAPVYAICRPIGRGLRPTDRPDSPSQEHQGAASCGNKSEPLREAGLTTSVGSSNTRTREEKTQMEPLRGQKTIRHGSAVHPDHSAQRPDCLWPAHRTVSSGRQCLAAAAELARLLPPLRRFSKRDLRSLIRPLTDAGWTIADIHTALDYRPSTGPLGREAWSALPQQNTGETDVDYTRRLRAAIRARLDCWRTEAGEVMLSPGQRQRLESAHGRAEARAAAERHAQRTARAPQLRSAAQRGAALARAALDAARRNN